MNPHYFRFIAYHYASCYLGVLSINMSLHSQVYSIYICLPHFKCSFYKSILAICTPCFFAYFQSIYPLTRRIYVFSISSSPLCLRRMLMLLSLFFCVVICLFCLLCLSFDLIISFFFLFFFDLMFCNCLPSPGIISLVMFHMVMLNCYICMSINLKETVRIHEFTSKK